jgi:transcriptional regulator with PAS, ATPase and Fis domain
LQGGEFIKIGSSRPQKANIRFIAATNSDLDRLMAKKLFRKDLYYRLRGGWLHLPPLRKRKNDIPLLINSFLEEFCGSAGADLEDEALSMLLDYEYPGNIRELKTIVQSAVNLCQGRPISAKVLPGYLRKRKSLSRSGRSSESGPILPLGQVEKNHILRVYRQLGKNKSRTARALGIGLNTLRRKLESYGVN